MITIVLIERICRKQVGNHHKFIIKLTVVIKMNEDIKLLCNCRVAYIVSINILLRNILLFASHGRLTIYV